MDRENLPIGVFDSGMGGLTVLKALRDQMPQESFIYLGDTARLPYGTKSAATVQHYALTMAKALVERRIKALVVACNTATTAALPHLQELLHYMPVIGVVEPGADSAVSVTKNQHIAVFATETTIASQAYQHNILKRLPAAKISVQTCSLLVTLAEEGMTDNRIVREAFLYYLQDFKDADTLLLGCTHFPVFKPLLQKLLPAAVQIVDSAEATAATVRHVLEDKGCLSGGAHRPTRFLVTDSVDRFARVGATFLGEPLSSQQIELIDA
ncbi:MAG: glutamate racemase [Legionellaceae bacterium]|nr:glutamate racemase [Legionellaceae bacterium]